MNQYNFNHYISQEMVDSFIKSTKDHNPIHNSMKVDKPVVPGFQLESIAEQYVNKVLDKEDFNRQKDLILTNIITRFSKKLYPDSYIQISINNSFPSRVQVSMFDKNKDLISNSDFKYALLKEKQFNSNRGENIATYPLEAKDLEFFYASTGFKMKKEVPFMFVPSMTSEALLDNVDVPKGLSPVYVKHGIEIYRVSKLNREVDLSLDSIKKRGNSYVVTDITATINDKLISKVNSSIFLVENP